MPRPSGHPGDARRHADDGSASREYRQFEGSQGDADAGGGDTADADEQSVLADLGGSLSQPLVASGDGQPVRH